MNNITPATITVIRAINYTHDKLVEIGLPGDKPGLNITYDPYLPDCLYVHSTNVVSVCMPKVFGRSQYTLSEMVYDAMATCGCHRQYKSDLREWNSTQGRTKLARPVLRMYRTPAWTKIRKLF